MNLDPDKSPRDFLLTLVAAGIMIWKDQSVTASQAWTLAEQFVAEGERKLGKLTP